MTDQLSPFAPPAAILDDPVPIATAAKFVGVNPRTIRRWVDTGAVAGYRFGPRMIRVSMREIAAMAQPIEAVVKSAKSVAEISDDTTSEVS